jgi:apolipoprotein N-acyltransferase
VTFARVAVPIIEAKGFRRALVAVLAGAASTLGLEPIGLWPALFVTFPVLVWLLDGIALGDFADRASSSVAACGASRGSEAAIAEIKRAAGVAIAARPSRRTRLARHIGPAAAIGWWFGFGYFVAGLYWLGNALLVDAKTYAWFLPFAVIGVPAGLAIFTSAGLVLARLLWTPGPLRVLTLAASLTLVEWLRGHVLTGFPWNTYGYALTSSLWLAQTSALVGIWMLTFIAVAVFASPATLADAGSRRWVVPRTRSSHTPSRESESKLRVQRGTTNNRMASVLSLPKLASRVLQTVANFGSGTLAPGAAAIVLIGMAAYGGARLAATPTRYTDGVELRIMQPDLQQDEKFNYGARTTVMKRYVSLSQRATAQRPNGMADVTLLIWPEAAFPFFLAYEGEALADIVDLLPPHALLITGAVRASRPDPDGRITHAYNSIYVLDHEVSVRALYDKVHLVPFGEYLPFQTFLERLGLMQLTGVRGGYIAGEHHKALTVPGAPPVLPLVCYEIIFPEEARAFSGGRPAWIVNVTNDGWFGLSSGPYQHFQQARVRAIELGLPLVRAANTGISAVVDPLGRVIASLPLGVEGVLDARLPQPVPSTLYTRIVDYPIFVGLFLIIGLAYWQRRRALTWT